jgi:TRAP-type C4-dicarboxylate transport system permease small subunit
MKKALSKLYQADALLATILFIVIFAVIVAEIFARTLRHSLLWSNDFCSFAVAWMLSFGMSAAFYKRDHLRIDFIREKFNPRVATILDIFTTALCTVFLMMLFPYSIRTAITKMKILYTSLHWPMGYTFAALPVFCVLSAVFSANNMVQAVRRAAGRRSE